MEKQIFTYRKAGTEDGKLLTELRTEVLRAANLLPEDTPLPEVEMRTAEYYSRCFKEDSHAAVLVYDGEKLAGCGGVSFYQVLPTCSNPSGKKAYIMNMYTRPAYRRKGIAFEVLDYLVKEAEKRGIREILLEATAAGRPLYERYGFAEMNHEMNLWR